MGRYEKVFMDEAQRVKHDHRMLTATESAHFPERGRCNQGPAAVCVRAAEGVVTPRLGQYGGHLRGFSIILSLAPGRNRRGGTKIVIGAS